MTIFHSEGFIVHESMMEGSREDEQSWKTTAPALSRYAYDTGTDLRCVFFSMPRVSRVWFWCHVAAPSPQTLFLVVLGLWATLKSKELFLWSIGPGGHVSSLITVCCHKINSLASPVLWRQTKKASCAMVVVMAFDKALIKAEEENHSSLRVLGCFTLKL